MKLYTYLQFFFNSVHSDCSHFLMQLNDTHNLFMMLTDPNQCSFHNDLTHNELKLKKVSMFWKPKMTDPYFDTGVKNSI